MTKYTQYRVKLKGKPELVALLSPYVQPTGLSLAEYRKLRDAVKTIFGEAIILEITSVSRGPGPRVTRL